MQGGVLCAAEKDFKTSFSYFYEAYEGYSTGGKDAQAIKALKYMMLSKIMSGLAGDVYNIINSKAGNKYAGSAAQALKAVADASRAKSLSMLEKAFVEHKEELLEDAIVKTHVTGLRNLLLEQNILRVLAPYSRVSIAKVAEHISMETPVVEDYLARMILDKKLHAMIDQTGDIIVSDEEKPDGVYIGAMKLVEELSGVVDTLNARTDSLAAGK
jgi:26S proteasome regulatory subunit N6